LGSAVAAEPNKGLGVVVVDMLCPKMELVVVDADSCWPNCGVVAALLPPNNELPVAGLGTA